jgi:hypothetical protein
MLSKCANPACSQSFRYLRDGKLFEIDTHLGVNSSAAGERKPSRRVEFFWLCGQCSTELTVVNDKDQGVITVPILTPTLAARRAAAS